MTPATYLIVADLAQAKGWTIAELARQAGISYSATRRAWLGGSEHTPSTTCAALAKALGVGLFDVIHPQHRHGRGSLDVDGTVRLLRQAVSEVLHERYGLPWPLRAPLSDTVQAQVQAIAAEIGPLPDVLALKAQDALDSAQPVAIVLAITEYSHPAFYAAYQEALTARPVA